MRTLYHVTLTLEDGEQRIYTRFGREAASKLANRLCWELPRQIVTVVVEPQSPNVRQPVVDAE